MKNIEDIERNYPKKMHDPAGNSQSDFETAITATNYGKFNLILLLIAIPSGWSSIFETTTMSYVFPAAQCDLNLSLSGKGSLNAITYAGMISSAFIWGYLCDTLGRRKLIIIGFFLDAMFVIVSATSQSYTVLMIAKFLGGFIINGPFAALTTYLAEFHSAKYRARTQMCLGIIFSTGTVILPLLAWAVLPLNLDFSLFSFHFHSWNIYLLICCLPPLISAIFFIFLPESPKFLMTTGRNDEALKIFRKVYSVNSGQSPESYPIHQLVDETNESNDTTINKHGGYITPNRTKIQALKEGWQQIKPLFFPPHLFKILLVCFMQMLFMMGLNSLRLWIPQILQAINDYTQEHNVITESICNILIVFKPSIHSSGSSECSVNLNNSFVYKNSIIIAISTICGYTAAGFLINKIGKKPLLNFLGIAGGCCALGIYFSKNIITLISLTAATITFSSICINVVLAVVIDLFPTSLRTMTVANTMMIGRIGAMLGNLIFPILLKSGCIPPFLFVGLVLIGCGLLSCLLPNTDLKPLK